MSFEQITNITAANGLNPQTYFDMSVSSLIAPKTTQGISGWIFDVPRRDELRIDADITDHYMEDNSFLQDHVIIKPVEITLTGLKGELVYKKPEGVFNLNNSLANKLSIVDDYLGDYTEQGNQNIQRTLSNLQRAQNTAMQLVDKTKNMIDLFSNDATTLQEVAFKQLSAMMYSKQLVTIQTPWNFYESMMILSVSFIQEEESDQYSDITIVLKEMRFAQTKTTTFNNDLFANRNTMQKSDEVNSAKQQGRNKTALLETGQAFGVFR
jgi:hypothetical protein